jgi:serine O-acetyltransferase
VAESAELEEFYRSPGHIRLDRRGPWLAEFREDLARYAAHHRGSRLKPLLLEHGVWALLHYRISSAILRSALAGPIKRPVLLACIASQKFVESVTGMSLPASADLYPGIYLSHFGPIVIHKEAVVESGCNISQGVSIGISGRGSSRGVPRIGKRVYIGANAVVAGPLSIGDDAAISANSFVNRDVPAGRLAMGVPAEIVSDRGSGGMGLHNRPN